MQKLSLHFDTNIIMTTTFSLETKHRAILFPQNCINIYISNILKNVHI